MKQCRLILKRIWHKVLFILFTAFIITGLNSLSVNAITLQEKCQEYKNKRGHNIQKINLNKATEKELEHLPGIGIKTARAIVDHRKSINGFKSLEQLRRVRGIGDETYNCLKDLVIVNK